MVVPYTSTTCTGCLAAQSGNLHRACWQQLQGCSPNPLSCLCLRLYGVLIITSHHNEDHQHTQRYSLQPNEKTGSMNSCDRRRKRPQKLEPCFSVGPPDCVSGQCTASHMPDLCEGEGSSNVSPTVHPCGRGPTIILNIACHSCAPASTTHTTRFNLHSTWRVLVRNNSANTDIPRPCISTWDASPAGTPSTAC